MQSLIIQYPICDSEGLLVFKPGDELVLLSDVEADHKKQIATLEAQVEEKDEQIEAAMFSGTQGEIIRTQKEQIAALAAERDLWKEAHHACDKDNSELRTENAVLIEAVEMLIKFIPDGWVMPLGYSVLVHQIERMFAGKEIDYPEDHEATLLLKTSTETGEGWIAMEMKEAKDG